MFHLSDIHARNHRRDHLEDAVQAFLNAGGEIREFGPGGGCPLAVAKVNAGGVLPVSTLYIDYSSNKPKAVRRKTAKNKGAQTIELVRQAMRKGLSTEDAAAFAGITKSYAYKIICSQKLRHLRPKATA